MPDILLDALFGLALAAPAVGALLTALTAARSGRTARTSTAVALVAAAVVLVVSSGSPITWSFGERLLVESDRLGSLLLVFVLSATLVVQAYAVRSLGGDVVRHRFFAASGVAATATATVVVAADLWVLVLGWVLVSLATVALLTHDGRPTARAAGRAACRTFLAGDALLVGAAVAASASVGPVSLRPEALAATVAGGEQVAGVSVVAILAVAAVAAAMTRSALPPTQSWLPMSVAAPTPSSAVLHAGIVNGGGVILIRFSPVLAASWIATGLAVAAGCAGVLVGGAVARTRPDVKTGLAWSTVAQMGFMVVQCVTGLLGPALVHMVAHGMYKANLFLGSGSTLAHTHPVAVDDAPRALRAFATAGVTLLAVGVAWLVVRPSSFDGVAGLVLAGFISVTVAQLSWAWLRARPTRSVLDAVALTALVGATTAAVALAAVVKAWLAPSLPQVEPSLAVLGAVALAVTGAAAAALAVAARHRPAWLRGTVDGLYLWFRDLGDPARRAPVMTPVEVRS